MIHPGTFRFLERDNQGFARARAAYPDRNPETVYRFGDAVLDGGVVYVGDGVTAGGVPLPTVGGVRDPNVVYPVGSLVLKPDNGKCYRGDGVTPGGILLADATAAVAVPVYWGKSASETLGQSGILALGTTNKTSAAGTYAFATGAAYAYLAFPASWLSPTAMLLSGFPLSTAYVEPYTTVFGDYWCALVTVNGTSYRVFRSDQIMAGDFTITAA